MFGNRIPLIYFIFCSFSTFISTHDTPHDLKHEKHLSYLSVPLHTYTHIDSHLFLFIKIVFPPHYLPFKTCLKLKTLKSQWQKWQNRTERGCKLKEIWGFSYLIVVVCCYSVTYTHFPQKMMTFLCFSFLLWKRRHENVVYFHHHRVEFSVTVTGFVWK